ncbi:MAG: ABC transporter ATP-binding protein [Candidatus Symbiobacter sp.]|nr:ABC transporter ATP-binding protein [Candidatus Symbiobacter sp.]
MENTTHPPAMISLKNVSCVFGSEKNPVHALRSVSFDIKAGEFFGLLGPSGSGKTTSLRVIAGFVQPNEGAVFLNGQDVTNVPPNKRQVNTVFQDYALFPHMTVGENVGYGLMVRGIKGDGANRQIEDALKLVRLSALIDRKPAELSGGQRQRVALARALVLKPLVLLLDEPLGALDLKLREQLQHELKLLHHETGVTFVFVTHDQHEAFSLCDRIGVFHEGGLAQIGTPQELYHRPNSEFVANFVGNCNFVNYRQANGQLLRYSIRPENCHLGGEGGAQMVGIVREIQYFGANYRLIIDPSGLEAASLAEIGHIEGKRSLLQVDVPQSLALGSKVYIHWDKNHLHNFPQDNFIDVEVN